MDMFGAKFNIILFFVFSTIFLSEFATACDEDQRAQGCRIDNGACSCAFGCKSEFRYANMQECMNALKGRSNDVCGLNPCMNTGSCIQVTQTPGYRCRCDGTGYWGNRCQRICPTPTDNVAAAQFPYECIVI